VRIIVEDRERSQEIFINTFNQKDYLAAIDRAPLLGRYPFEIRLTPPGVYHPGPNWSLKRNKWIVWPKRLEASQEIIDRINFQTDNWIKTIEHLEHASTVELAWKAHSALASMMDAIKLNESFNNDTDLLQIDPDWMTIKLLKRMGYKDRLHRLLFTQSLNQVLDQNLPQWPWDKA
jgi:hypothetical protein